MVLELQSPDSLVPAEKVIYDFSAADSTVTANGIKYRVNRWVKSDYGVLRFIPNPYYEPSKEPGKFFFSLVSVNAMGKGLAGTVKVASTNKQSTVITLTIRDNIPQRGERIINEVIRTYLNASVEAKNSQAKKTRDFVNDRLNEVKGELGTIEGNIQSFKDGQSAVDLSEQSRNYLASRQKSDQLLGEVNLKPLVLDQVKNMQSPAMDRMGWLCLLLWALTIPHYRNSSKNYLPHKESMKALRRR